MASAEGFSRPRFIDHADRTALGRIDGLYRGNGAGPYFTTSIGVLHALATTCDHALGLAIFELENVLHKLVIGRIVVFGMHMSTSAVLCTFQEIIVGPEDRCILIGLTCEAPQGGRGADALGTSPKFTARKATVLDSFAKLVLHLQTFLSAL